MHLLDDGCEAWQPPRRRGPLTPIHEPGPIDDGEALVFGRFLVLLRRRELLADGVPVQVGDGLSISCWFCSRPTERWSARTS
jgi:hypothetical protein